MKTVVALLLTMAASTTMAGSALVSNPNLAYPPSCARLPDLGAPGGIEGQAARFHDRQITLSGTRGESVPVRLRAYRAPCSEPNRSLIWLEFMLSAQYANSDVEILLPYLGVETAPNYAPLGLDLTDEPESGSRGREAQYLLSRTQGLQRYFVSPTGDRRWVFLVTSADSGRKFFSPFETMTANQYNGAFKLIVSDKFAIEVPATRDLLRGTPPKMPLSGRLAGNWIVPGTADQGLLLSVSERVAPDMPGVANDTQGPMIAFLAHYTFDNAGDMLWLTGAAEFQPGAESVTIPIEKVTGGEFRGDTRANRQVIGSVTLRVNNCNDLTFNYDYRGVGLGSGQRRLARLNSLEIAGFDCRDFQARKEASQ